MDQYVGEIRMFGGSFAPVGWAMCDGSLLPISQFDALFALIGTTYGGDGQTTFAVPDLRGRVPIHQGQNPTTGTTFTLGQKAGVETVTLTSQQMPVHTHQVHATTADGTVPSPSNGLWAKSALNEFSTVTSPVAAMAADAVSTVGGSQPHANMMPYQCVNFIIATEGMWPQQN
jgi:microcystin-dependent protein